MVVLMLPAPFVVLTSTVCKMSAVQWSLTIIVSSGSAPVSVMTSSIPDLLTCNAMVQSIQPTTYHLNRPRPSIDSHMQDPKLSCKA
jgi:hypothetical protein